MEPSRIVNGAPIQDKNRSLRNGEDKIFERDPCFKRFERPLGMEQHYFNRLGFIIAHSLAVYYLYLYFTGEIKARTWIWELVYGYIGILGITVGAHRYWSHKTFKAKKPLQYLLMIMQTLSGQYPIFKWSLEHRIHHKYTDTDADPHNSRKGFWWSHWIWLFYPKPPEVQKKLETMDMSDLENDPIVRFQSQHYWKLYFLFYILIPVPIVMYIYDVPLMHAIYSAHFKYVYMVHITFSVNSLAHVFGDRPYDKNIRPADNMIVAFLTHGEGWHNYHHAFPWDYKAAEFGWKMNLSTMLIDFFAWIGWAYDLKMVSKEVLNGRVKRTGDGTHWTVKQHDHDNNLNKTNDGDIRNMLKNEEEYFDIGELQRSMDRPSWGWDDKSDTMEVWRQLTTIANPEKTQ